MKTALCLLLFVVPAFAGKVPDEADYPTQYAVMNAIKVGGVMIGKFCSMSLRDQAAPTVLFTVMRQSYGGCHVWDAGTVFHGRRKKESIELLTKDDKGELKVESWSIKGTIAYLPPPAQ